MVIYSIFGTQKGLSTYNFSVLYNNWDPLFQV